ncbi:MAG: hypothetical protein ABI787_01840 [Spartobacteria bacterium]
MNDFSELESELKKLRPAAVSPALRARVEQAMLRTDATATAGVLPRTSSGKVWWSFGLGLAAASALVLLGLTFFAKAPTPAPIVAQTSPAATLAQPQASGLQPSALTQVVYRRRDEGLIFSPNQSERVLRRVRYQTRETMQWRNPETGASLRVSYPAEQVVLSPVSFQ